MSGAYSVGAIGSDPIFQAYMAQQMQNYAVQQNDATRVAQTYQPSFKANPTDSATQIMTSKSVSSKSEKEESHTKRNLAIALGAAAIIYTLYKGNGNPIEGAKTIGRDLKGIWNKVFNSKNAAEGAKNIKEILGKDVQEYTVMKDGMEFVMNGKNPVKIITADKQVITDAAKITEWVKNNSAAESIIKGLDVSSGVLPKGVSLSYTKEIAEGANTYRLVVENGKVVKALSKDKAGKFIEVAEKDLSSFISNHAAQVKEAETLTKTTTLDKVRLLNKKGVLYDAGTQNVTWSVRNGQVVSANIGGRTLKPEEIKALQRDFGAEIKLFGKEAAGTYKDIQGFEYIYRTSKADTGVVAGQRIRFNPNVSGHTGTNWITGVNGIEHKELSSTVDIENFLKNHAEMKDELSNISSSGIFSNGYSLGNYQVKATSGNIYVFDGGKKIRQIKLADGTVISGNKAIEKWRKVAANQNEYAKYCG